MPSVPPGEKNTGPSDLPISRPGRRTHLVGLLLGGSIFVVAVVAIAGTLQWWNLWVFLAFMAVLGWLSGKAVGKSPGLAEERRTASSKARRWNQVVVLLVNLTLPTMVVLAAVDRRFRWLAAVPVAVSLTAFAAMALGVAVTYRAIAVNPFFSSHIRIQSDRAHTVIATGPYRVVRHPGYAGAIVFNLLVSIALGSWVGLPIGVVAALLLAYRTAKEDGILSAELAGYAEYTRQVPSRPIPRVW